MYGTGLYGGQSAMFRILTISTLTVVIFVLLAPARQAVAQQRPGIRAQIIAPEGCSISDPVDTENVFNFIATQIQALSFARAGERARLHSFQAGMGTPNSQVPNFVGLREERIDNTCAGFILSPYSGSKIVGVATAAKTLVSGYQELAKMPDEMLGIALREAYPAGSGSPTRADLSNRRQEILRRISDAVNSSLLLLIHTDAEGKPSDLLGPEERHSLLTFLDSRFPVRGAVGYSGDFFSEQAGLIRSFLSGGNR